MTDDQITRLVFELDDICLDHDYYGSLPTVADSECMKKVRAAIREFVEEAIRQAKESP